MKYGSNVGEAITGKKVDAQTKFDYDQVKGRNLGHILDEKNVPIPAETGLLADLIQSANGFESEIVQASTGFDSE